jgi:hypothetical protein
VLINLNSYIRGNRIGRRAKIGHHLINSYSESVIVVDKNR